MKVSENTAETPSALTAWPNRTSPVAPWWHTAILIVVILGISILSTLQSKSAASFGGGHLKRYAITIAWEWILGLIAWWGLRIRGTPVREILGERRRGFKEFARDFGIALVFWIIAMVVLAAIGIFLRLVHLVHLQKAVLAIAPQTIAQIFLWLALCATAGMVEEFVFRGYLLQQFASLCIHPNARGGLWIGVFASSLLFGAAHGYEGVGGMISITAYGVMFCLLAIHRRSLRAGMIAHAWHDSVTGILIAVAKHAHLV